MTNNSTNHVCNPVNKSSLPGFIFFYSLVFVVGLILNSYTLWFHLCRPRQKVPKSWMIYLKNLTAADFLLCLGLPLRIVDYAGRSDKVHLFYCTFGAPVFYINMYISVLLMGYIAVSRYMKIFHHLRTSFLMTARAARFLSGATWVFSLVPMLVYIILMLNTDRSFSGARICDVLQSESVKVLYKVFHAGAAIIFLSVLSLLIFCYCSASRRVFQIQRRQEGSSNCKKLVKSRRNMLVLVSVFCICFLPYHLVRLLYIILQGQCSVLLYYLKEVTVLISVFNVCLDPLIYVFLCKEFRAQLNLQHMFSTTKDNSSISVSEAKDETEEWETNRPSSENTESHELR
ncbi:P2Y purinoceptor 14-like [Xiphophorus couchianus]|uniref:P2Y purinoceptor 14-like n=1 Tax=Xiphophorus couchianus TaxID=32473 RepID=UPI00101619D6|nr:P2Y purinoceptor 14-like [Xiphophorus couchianus]